MDRILLLEDEPTLRHSLCRVLVQSTEAIVREAGSLKQALALLDERPDLVISDLDLPDGSGLDLFQELTSRELNVPAIVITAHLSRYRGQLPATSSVDILEKPIDSEELSRLVRQRLASGKGAPRSPFSVADYLQLAGLARRNVCLTITGEGGARGKIVVQDGQTTWAEDQLGEGIAAFRRLALLPRAEVVCRPEEAAIAAPNVQGSLEHLLLDAARAGDEQRQVGEGAEPERASMAPEQHEPVSEVGLAGAGRQRSSCAGLRVAKPDAPVRVPPRPALAAVAAEGAPRLLGRAPGEMGRKEIPMTMTKPLKPVPSLDKLVTQQSALAGAARAKKDGSVLDLAGQIDAETTCAVVTVAARQLEELAADLGLGDIGSWHLSMGKSTWYVASSGDEMVVALGGPNKNPTSTLGKVEESLGKRP